MKHLEMLAHNEVVHHHVLFHEDWTGFRWTGQAYNGPECEYTWYWEVTEREEDENGVVWVARLMGTGDCDEVTEEELKHRFILQLCSQWRNDHPDLVQYDKY